MLISTKAIVLKTVKYGETSLIVSLYTEALGVQSCIIQGVRKTAKSGNAKSSYFIVGTLLHVTLYHFEHKNLQRIKDYQYQQILPNITTSIVKNAIVVMMMELLHHTIQEPEQNEDLFTFIENCLLHIESAYHIELKWIPHYFCTQLANHLGFGIQTNYNPQTATYLYLVDGTYSPTLNDVTQYCNAEQSSVIHAINNASLINLAQISIPTQSKRNILHKLLQYFSIHIPHMPAVKSVAIFETIFDE